MFSNNAVTERQRVSVLRSYEILDTPPDASFDDMVDVVRAVLRVPIAYISLVDSDRQWFKSRRGIDIQETSRESSICTHALLSTEPLVIEDTLDDERFRSNPYVAGPPGIRFYLGAPILAAHGAIVGTLCALDTEPRRARQTEVKLMRALARQTDCLLELHRLRSTTGRLANTA